MSPPPIPLLLLKTPTSPIDAYTTLFTSPPTSSCTYTPHYIPVLTHHSNLSPLFPILDPLASSVHSAGSLSCDYISFPYGGLIFTSARAVDAFATALGNITTGPGSAAWPNLKSLRLPLYAVGPATADALRGQILHYLPGCEIVGEEAGSGEVLAPLIVKGYSSPGAVGAENDSGRERKPLLFLVGEKHKDVIPRVLRAGGIEVQEVVVYRTVERKDFRCDLDIVLEKTADAKIRWIIIFSAAGVEAMLRALGWLDEETRRARKRCDGQERKTFVASIGPTTRDYMRKKFDFEVDVCAERPSPEGVREGIERFARERLGMRSELG